jgi:hypothetical protein
VHLHGVAVVSEDPGRNEQEQQGVAGANSPVEINKEYAADGVGIGHDGEGVCTVK